MATWIYKDYLGTFNVDGEEKLWDMFQWAAHSLSDEDRQTFAEEIAEADVTPTQLKNDGDLVIEPITESYTKDGVTLNRQIGRKHYFFNRDSAWGVHANYTKWEAAMRADPDFVSMPASTHEEA